MSTYPFSLSNAKNILQTHFVHEKLGEPIYVSKSFQLVPTGVFYQSSIEIEDDTFYSVSNHQKKVEAEKDAAYEACKYLHDHKKLYIAPSVMRKLDSYKEIERGRVISVNTAKSILEHYAIYRHVPRPDYDSVLESKTGMWRSKVSIACAYNGLVYTVDSKTPDKNKTTSEKIAAMELCSILTREDPEYVIPRVFLQQQ